MVVTTSDTLEAAKGSRNAGFSEAQSEALARVMKQAGQVDISHLATKADLAEAKADILKWTMGAIGLQTLAILGGVVAIFRLLPT